MAMGAILNLCKLWTFAREFLWQILMCCLVESNEAVRAKKKTASGNLFWVFRNFRKSENKLKNTQLGCMSKGHNSVKN